MGVFDHLQKKGSFVIQPKRPQIRKVEAKLPPKPSPKPEPRSTPATSRSKSAGHSYQTSRDSTPSQRSSSTQRLGPPSRSISRKRRSPVLRLSSSDDDSDTDTSFEVRKRVKLSASVEPDLDRRVRHKKAFIEGVDQSISMVHAAEITSVEKPSKFKTAFEGSNQPAKVKLQYPSASPMERYQLVVPREKDDFRPLDDIVQVMEVVSQNYIPDEYLHLFDDETTGFKRRIRKSLAHGSAKEFCSTLDDYNTTISRLRRDGVISKHLDQAHSLTLSLVERILTQIYSRTVSPRVHSLREYENGTDNVYGELLPRFVSNIFKETKLKSNQIFVDLGSGVGNVVLQAALEVGCESWGCEMMHNACDLAQLQEREFRVRSRLWGLAVGKTHLIRGDFLKEDSVTQILSKADVVLINNQAFTPQLNNELINHFLDMKEGCQIVSLKSFVPAGHKIQARNLNSPINLLTVKQKEYWSDSVSWTDAGGTYFIAKKDSSRLKAFMDDM